MPRFSIVLPTFNEAGQIRDLLAQLESACRDIDYEIVVVDDNSPDGTHGLVTQASVANPRIVPVLRTKEKGLATAVIEGMRRARGDFVIVMDSDFQHPPETVARLAAAAESENADLVVASRYAKGGEVHDFPLVRRIISWGAKTLSVLFLPRVRHFRITDPMSGFFLVRRAAVDPEALTPRGYKILIEVIAKAEIHRAAEVGFVFATRRGGESKLRIRTQVDYFLHVVGLGIRDRENQRLFFFLLIGLSGIVVNLAAYALAKAVFDDKFPQIVSSISYETFLLIPASIAREASILWNFWWNDSITFRDLRAHAHAGFLHRVLRFNLVSIAAWVAYLALFYILVRLGVHDVAAILVSIFLTFFINYRGNRRWTYARRRDAAQG